MTSQSIQDGASQLDNAIFPAQQQNCQEKNPVNGNFIWKLNKQTNKQTNKLESVILL